MGVKSWGVGNGLGSGGRAAEPPQLLRSLRDPRSWRGDGDGCVWRHGRGWRRPALLLLLPCLAAASLLPCMLPCLAAATSLLSWLLPFFPASLLPCFPSSLLPLFPASLSSLLPLPASLLPFFPASLLPFFPACFPVSLPASLLPHLHVCFPASPACFPAFLPVSLVVSLFPCLPASLPARAQPQPQPQRRHSWNSHPVCDSCPCKHTRDFEAP